MNIIERLTKKFRDMSMQMPLIHNPWIERGTDLIEFSKLRAFSSAPSGVDYCVLDIPYDYLENISNIFEEITLTGDDLTSVDTKIKTRNGFVNSFRNSFYNNELLFFDSLFNEKNNCDNSYEFICYFCSECVNNKTDWGWRSPSIRSNLINYKCNVVIESDMVFNSIINYKPEALTDLIKTKEVSSESLYRLKHPEVYELLKLDKRLISTLSASRLKLICRGSKLIGL